MSPRRKHLQRYQIQKILQERKIVLFYHCSNVRAEKWEFIKKSLLSAMTGNALEKAEEKFLPPLTLSPSVSEGNLSMATPFTTLLVKNRIGQQCGVLEKLISNSAHTIKHLVHRVSMINSVDQGRAIKSLDNRPTETNQGLNRCLSGADQKSAVMSSSKLGFKLFQGPTFLFACNSHREMVLGCEIINTKSQRETSLTLLGGIYHGKIMNHLDLIQLAKLDRRVHTSLANCLEETISCLLYNALSFHQSRLLLYLHYYAATLFDPLDSDRRSAPGLLFKDQQVLRFAKQ